MKLRAFAAAFSLSAFLSGSVHGEQVHVVRPLSGYACMTLNITPQQSMDFSFHVPVRGGPSVSAATLGWAGANVAARSPEHVVNGFAEVLFPTGQTGWIEANMLRPYGSVSNPNAKCVPALLSNGRPGFSYR